MKTFFFTLLLITNLPGPAKADEIPPPCLDHFFSLFRGAIKEVKLSDCAHIEGKLIKREGRTVIWERPREESGGHLGFLHIEEIGELNDAMTYLIFNNTGGSGVFTWLMAVRRENGVLRKTMEVVGGDRCSGGLSSAMIKDNHILVKRNMTPFMVASYLSEFATDRETAQIKERFIYLGRDDWPYCAICCVAEQENTYSFAGELEDESMLHLDLEALRSQAKGNAAVACLLGQLKIKEDIDISFSDNKLQALANRVHDNCGRNK